MATRPSGAGPSSFAEGALSFAPACHARRSGRFRTAEEKNRRTGQMGDHVDETCMFEGRRGIAGAVGVVALVLGGLAWFPVALAGSRSERVAPVRKVLFVGNSLTMANDLPARVQALAASVGDHLDCRAVAFPDFSLEDHWKQGEATRVIGEGGWSIVILQQGPSSLPESRRLLIDYARRFDGEARRVGARTALYMVWPSRARFTDFDGVSASYAAAALDVGGLLMPVGEAWRAAWRRDDAVALYSDDGFHPTPLATHLAALVIYQQLSGRSPIGLSATLSSRSPQGTSVTMSAADALRLEQAAAEANARFARR
jgi:hypothetical protein